MRQSLLTVALLILAWLAWMLRDLVMLIGFAALLAYALDPLVGLVERIPLPGRRAMPRGLSAALVILALVAVVGWALAEAVPRLIHELGRFADSAPATFARLDRELRHFADAHGLGGLLGQGPAGGAKSPVLDAVKQWAMSILGGVFGNLGQIAGLVLLPVLAFYLLADRRAVHTSALAFVPQDLRPQAERLLNAVEPALRAYVRGQGLVCLVMGTTMALVLKLLGFPVVLLLGVVIGLAEVIPFLGFWLAAIGVAVAGYSVSPTLALAGIASYIVVNSLLGYFVTPRLLGREVKMHPFLVTVSILAGGALLGPAGSILALPAAAMTQAAIAEFAPSPPKSRP